MNKLFIWVGAIIILFVIGSCSADTTDNPSVGNSNTSQETITKRPEINQPEPTNSTSETILEETNPIEVPDTEETTPVVKPTAPSEPPEETNPNASVPVLGNIEYWDVVKPEIISMLNDHNLYVAYIDNGYPYVNITVEYGVKNEEGKAIATGISQTEYCELVAHVKQELHVILDKYKIQKPKTWFHACNSHLGIFFKNWFYDEQRTPHKVISEEVAWYQIDLLEYYYERGDDSFTLMNGMSETIWSKYPIYTPQ